VALVFIAAQAAKTSDFGSKTKPDAVLSNNDQTARNIARLVSKMLERQHFSQKQFDDEVSERFFDRYFEMLDGQHLHFLQSDIAEFEPYRKKLDDLTSAMGDTKPAHLIFARMLERVEQRVAYANELLKTEKFYFNIDERYIPNRRQLPRPKDLAEAKQLWRQHLRYELLSEKLSMPDTNKLSAAKTKLTSPKSASINPKETEPRVTSSGDTNKLLAAIPASVEKSASGTKGLKPDAPQTQEEVILSKVTKRYANLERTS
jgi:hypothetical protein